MLRLTLAVAALISLFGARAEATSQIPWLTPRLAASSIPAPGSPVIANVYGTSVTVTYSAVLGYNGYEVDACTASDFSAGCFSATTSNAAITTLTPTGLSYNTLYYMRAGTISGQTTTYANTVPASTITAVNTGDPLGASLIPSVVGSTLPAVGGVWVGSSLDKVWRSTGTNVITSVSSVTMSCARNEICGFQVHVHSYSSGWTLAGATFSVTDAVSGTTISSNNAVTYVMFDMNITTPSNTAYTHFGSTGFIPTIMVPVVDPYWAQTCGSCTIAMSSGMNVSLYGDIHVPSAAPAGYYTGTFSVSSNSVNLAKIRLVVAVWDYIMPSTPTLNYYAGTEGIGVSKQNYNGNPEGSAAAAYPGSTGDEFTILGMQLRDQALLCQDHRISCLGNLTANGGLANIFPSTTEFRTTYECPLVGTGCNAQPILTGSVSQTSQILGTSLQTNSTAQSLASESLLRGWNPAATFFNKDEPSGSDFTSLVQFSTPMHTAVPPIPILCTTSIANLNLFSATNGCDYLIPSINVLEPVGSGSSSATYASYLAGIANNPSGPTRKFWSYGACNSFDASCGNAHVPGTATYPSEMADALGVSNRIMEWMTYFHNQVGELYYDINYCSNYTCKQYVSGSMVAVSTDAWDNIWNFGGNGDGTLVFQGSNRRTGFTIPVTLPSLMLKNKRDGVQDFELFTKATAAGLGTTVQTQIRNVITNSYTYNVNPDVLLAARRVVGNALHAVTWPGSAGSPY